MGCFFEYTGSVGAAQAGLLYQCKPAGVLSLLQEAATQAACEFHASAPEMLEKYHALWMVVRMWYSLSRPLLWGDRVTVKTWHRADRGAMLYRDFDLFIGDERVGEAVSVWVAADVESRRLLHLSCLEEVSSTGGEELCKERKLGRIKLPGEMVPGERRRFHYSDTDCNGHVNNVHYADVAADAAQLELLLPQGEYVSSFQIDYMKECRAGEALDILTARTPKGCYVQGVDELGVSRFCAFLALCQTGAGFEVS